MHLQCRSGSLLCTRGQLVILTFLSRTCLEGPVYPFGLRGAAVRVTKHQAAAAAEPRPLARRVPTHSLLLLLSPSPEPPSRCGYHSQPHPPPCTSMPLPAGGGSHIPSPDPTQTFLWPRVPSPSVPLAFLFLLSLTVPGTGEVLRDQMLPPVSLLPLPRCSCS